MTSKSNFFKSVEDYVSFVGGDHAIKKILIANNGIGAIKAIRSIRRWSYETFGNERTVQFVVMATPEDMRANAEYIRMADEVVDVPGGTNNNNYANVSLICEIAERMKVDAVMPMWGHASENPTLPNSLLTLSRRVTFIGPSAGPMQALGDKIGSTIIAQSAGVPTIAWNGDDLRVDYQATGIPEAVYDQANVKTAEDALACAVRIGFPVMIKASEGGGGKGIRKVTREEDVQALFRQVASEIPGSPIFVMKMASNARHLEVQLLADKYGEAIALSGRDCSVQRRHQKIIEEGPPTAASPQVFKQMERAAVSLAKTVGYCNAGTVEYLFMEETKEFAFLELNPRLQVEHPVTENILLLNLPACQLQVAMGAPLHRIPDIRKMYGRHPRGRDTIDFEYSERVQNPRHCIAVRITAENPEAEFQPTSGKIRELQFRSSIDVWGYFSVNNSGNIHEFADSQFGHIFAHGTDRENARKAMVMALKELQIRGDIRTTTEYIIKMLQSQDFIDNKIDTAWLDARIARHKELTIEEAAIYNPPPTLVVTCAAALQGFKFFESNGREFIEMLNAGQIPSKESLPSTVSIDLIFNNIKYQTKSFQSGANNVTLECNGDRQQIYIRPLSDEGYLLEAWGKSHLIYSNLEKDGSLRMVLDGHTCIFTPEYDPTKLTSSVAGKLARLLVADGSHLNAGEPYVEIEVMKMYMPLKASEAGIVSFQMSEGATLTPGDLIACMTLDHPERVVRSDLFRGVLSMMEGGDGNLIFEADPELIVENQSKPHLQMRSAKSSLEKILQGFSESDGSIDDFIQIYISSLNHPLLPAFEVEEALSVLRGRIDGKLFDQITQINSDYIQHTQQQQEQQSQSTSSHSNHIPLSNFDYPASSILTALHEFAKSLPMDKRIAFNTQTSNVWMTAEPYFYPNDVRVLASMLRLIENYLSVEGLFDKMSFTDVVNSLRKDHSSELEKVLALCRSHININAKNSLLIKVMEIIKGYSLNSIMQRVQVRPSGFPLRSDSSNIRNLKLRLSDIAKLKSSIYSHVSFAANLILMEQTVMTTEVRRQKLNDTVIRVLTTNEPTERLLEIKKFIDSGVNFRDLLTETLRNDKDYQIAVMELYVRQVYRKTHNITSVVSQRSEGGGSIPLDEEGFTWIKFHFMTKSPSLVSVEYDANDSLSYSELVGMFKPLTIDTSNTTTSTSTSSTTSGSPPVSPLSPISPLPVTPSSPSRRDSTVHASLVESEYKHTICSGSRVGLFVTIDNYADLPFVFTKVIEKIPKSTINPQDSHFIEKNAVHVIVLEGVSHETSEDELSEQLSQMLTTQSFSLKSRGIRRVTFFLGKDPQKQSTGARLRTFSASHTTSNFSSNKQIMLTFRSKFGYGEDRLFRSIEATHGFHLDLDRLRNFSLALIEGNQTPSGNVHIYRATPLMGKEGPRRYFARLVCFTGGMYAIDTESLFVEALDGLSIAIRQEDAANSKGDSSGKKVGTYGANHIYLNILAPDDLINGDVFEADMRAMMKKYWYRMVRLTLTEVEIKLSCKIANELDTVIFRYVASNPTGHVLDIHKYYEANEKGVTIYRSFGDHHGPWDGQVVDTPYATTYQFEKERSDAMASSDTLYVYDWPTIFQSAIEHTWSNLQLIPDTSDAPVFTCSELVLCDAETREPFPPKTPADVLQQGVMLPIDRPAGINSAGMVAWLFSFRTPECPAGREVIIIANDITHQAGSFGTKEDVIFFKASELARSKKIPRIYLAANSGARIGMAESLKKNFRVCWNDPSDPAKGFRYIYLSQEDYENLVAKYESNPSQMPVICSPLSVTLESTKQVETRYLITDIIGEEADLGVENLMGSGLIAGETSRAYDDIFTLTLVVGRTVGIGAYLVRLGQRTIQKTKNSPIILTGYQALNKLMGREIYTTNDQLGGPMIMFPNGVSHLLADSHMDSVEKAIQWLSFVPVVKGSPLPVLDLASTRHDVIERDVEFAPQKGQSYDPRLLLCGIQFSSDSSSYSSWVPGFFDRNSFVEALGGWAKTVVIGRGRLGGIPMGVIVTENRTAEATKPADPADITSREKMVQQAGGVWFPDSAYKTAQALKDFNREGIPCIVFANWRGFSGGQRDMFDEVLKFGSMIVDALVAYQQPLFVYIPPFAELRGGAWVVVDSTINSDVMEFYAAEDARGGVLEATGAASIKFREREIIAAIHRLDHVVMSLDASLAQLKTTLSSASEDSAEASEARRRISQIQKDIKHREKLLTGVYQQVAVHFADLHDTPGRMKAKGVIRKQVQWAKSRAFFYWRLRRRLIEFQFANDVSSTSTSSTSPVSTKLAPGQRKAAIRQFQTWFLTEGWERSKREDREVGANAEEVWEDDKAFTEWSERNESLIQKKIRQDKKESLVQHALSALQYLDCESDEESDGTALEHAIKNLPTSTREKLLAALNK